MDELREEAAQDPDNDSPDGELPDYMARMIQQFEENDIVVVEGDEVFGVQTHYSLPSFSLGY